MSRLHLARGRGGVPVAPLLFAPLNGSLTAHDAGGDFALTSSGPVRYRDGAAGGYQAALIEENFGNFITNPLFAVDTAGWAAAVNGALTRDTGYAYAGPASGLLTASAADAEAVWTATFSAVNRVFAVVVKNNAAVSRTFQLRYNGADIGSPATLAAGEERRIRASFTGTAGSASLGIRVTDSVNTETFSIGHVQVEAHTNGYATTPIPEVDGDGTIQAGYTWAGTPHASIPTRAGTVIRCPESGHIDPARGALTAWVYLEYDRTAGIETTDFTDAILSAGTPSSAGKDFLEVRVSSVLDAPRIAFQANNGVNNNLAGVTSSVPAEGWNLIYADWFGTVQRIGVGLASLTVGAREVPSGSIVHANGMAIGCRASSLLNQADARIGPLAIFDGPLTPNRRQLLYDAGPAWDWALLSRAL